VRKKRIPRPDRTFNNDVDAEGMPHRRLKRKGIVAFLAWFFSTLKRSNLVFDSVNELTAWLP
jgi:hypothetical protein